MKFFPLKSANGEKITVEASNLSENISVVLGKFFKRKKN